MTRAQIQAATEKFLNRGGKIRQCPEGMPQPTAAELMSMLERIVDAAGVDPDDREGDYIHEHSTAYTF